MLPQGEPGEPAKESEKVKLPAASRRALEVLANLCAVHGKSGAMGTPSGALSIVEDMWRDRFYEDAMPGADMASKRKSFRNAADRLIGMHMVGMGSGRVWLAERRSSRSAAAAEAGGRGAGSVPANSAIRIVPARTATPATTSICPGRRL